MLDNTFILLLLNMMISHEAAIFFSKVVYIVYLQHPGLVQMKS